MQFMEQYQPPINAPDFPDGLWLNTSSPISWEDQRQSFTLIDFFDYTCINCLRTLPYLRAWQEIYAPLGLRLYGIHTPEFSFAHDPDIVKSGISRLGVHWPVFLDNDQTLWTAYANRYWPSLYLIDYEAKIRFRHVGEGGYREIEKTIQACIVEHNPDVELPDLLDPIRPEDAQDAYCPPTSPEIQLGSVHNLDLAAQEPKEFTIPEQLEPDHIFLEGFWRVTRDGITLTSKQGMIALQYKAAEIYAVLSPYPDDRKGLPSRTNTLYIQVFQDKAHLSPENFGQDVLLESGHAMVRVDFPRLYNLAVNPEVGTHELRLQITGPGLTLYAFTFGSCLSTDSSNLSPSKE